MVIGNGEMGRLCADSLVEMGCHVTVTLRTYRHGETIVPRGCDTIPYEERELLIPNVDIIVSATASPHFTLTKAMLEQAPRRPKILVDLAVPRDIDPEAEELEGVQCYNIDTIGSGEEVDGPELGRVRKIIAQETEHFYDWLNIHNCRDSIENIKRITFKKVSGGLMSGEVSEEERERVELAVYKTIDLLMYSIKEQLSPELVEGIEQHILTSKNGGKPIE